MFVYSIKSEFLAKYDPYWVCRLLALKAATAAIALCLWNAFFFTPTSPGLYFMTTLIGVIATEMLPVYSKKEQLLIYWKLILMIAITVIIFGFISYFNFIELAGVTVLTYLYFRVLTTDTQSATVPAILIMFGIIGTESGNTDINTAINSLFFFIELGLVGTVVVLLFPNFRDKTFKSAFLRLLQKDLSSIKKGSFSNNDQAILNDLSFMKAQLPRLNQTYSDLYTKIISYQIALAKENKVVLEPSSPLTSLIQAVSNEQILDQNYLKVSANQGMNDDSIRCISNLINGWNQVCKV